MTRVIGTLSVFILYTSMCLGDEPKNAISVAKQGDESYVNGDYDDAIANYREAIRLSSIRPNVFSELAPGSPFKTDNRKVEVGILDESRLKSQLARAYQYRGEIRLRLGKYDEAIADFNDAVLLDANNSSTYRSRGYAWKGKGDLDNAIADFNKCLRLAPADAWAFGSRANVWRSKHKYAEAIADYSEAQRLDPESPYAYNSLAWIWSTCPEQCFRNGKKAVEYATKACELSQWKSHSNVSALAAAYAETEKFEEAIKWQEKAIELATQETTKETARLLLELYKLDKPYREKTDKSSTGSPPKNQYVIEFWLLNQNGWLYAPKVLLDEGGKTAVNIGESEKRKLEATAQTRDVQKPDRQLFDIKFNDTSIPEKAFEMDWTLSFPDKCKAFFEYGWRKGFLYGITVTRR
ncbi:MAG: tetratricopeptide repeat protein [Planctomycetes bacterium]|nr:tetratricopeptide repeat protein [Planctomycetota bacterium]